MTKQIELPLQTFHRIQNRRATGLTDASGRSVAETSSTYYGTTDKDAKETAEFLRRRVNMHDRLVEMVASLAAEVEPATDDPLDRVSKFRRALIVDAEKLLAEAKGEGEG